VQVQVNFGSIDKISDNNEEILQKQKERIKQKSKLFLN
jgi:hypothetical protein